MGSISFSFRIALALTAVLGGRMAAASEPWADKNLPVVDGLTAWFDATAETPARRAAGQPRLKDGAKVAIWHDGSGHARHLTQTKEDAQPLVRADDPFRLIRFNGETTSLSAAGLDVALNEMTVFVVAAPFSNDGMFRGLLAANATNTNDYVTGFNIDQGPDASSKFANVNVEGPGFGGAYNLKTEPTPFGHIYRLCVASAVGKGGTALYINGNAAGRRDRTPGTIRMDQLTVGARYYTNGGPPETRGFFSGEIAELLIYDRRLTDAERTAVDQYLLKKYGDMHTVPLPPGLLASRPIPPVADPPPVQMLTPGFTVRELPLKLPNINNLRYRADGKLVAMGYDGRIWLLSDTDGDGLEDRADVFWDQPGIVSPIGIALTPPKYQHGQGVFIACKGQVVLVVDTDGDNRADRSIVVAEGWKPLEHSVDAMGITLDAEGNVYFGLGTQDFTNAYLIDPQGQGHYAADSERGTIMKLSADFKRRERICSGVRFSVALAFNRAGDLFCTDQEGATWLPNGNPFDELLHIQPGRHYGFPPRHPKHLPGVLDEPSVYDYAPQHQSACGLCFNEAAAAGKTLGPDWWAGDALVCGYSRGKLYRTTLVKTPLGYVADNALVGCLNMLTVDAALSPQGNLVLAAHSGGPDWGSGPGGQGRLYQLSYRDCPQPVRAWSHSPHELAIEFDRPLEPADFKRFSQGAQIEYGANVRAGDRFESLRPGYSVVELQTRSTRRLLPVLGAQLTADARTLVLATDRHEQAVGYAVILPDGQGAAPSPTPHGLPQLPTVELSYDLTGVEAQWQPAGGDAGWTSWLPHLDLAAASGLLKGSQSAKRIADSCTQPGTLTLRTQLDLWQMLRPAVQPGSKLDASLPAEQVTLVLESAQPVKLKTPSNELQSKRDASGKHAINWTVPSEERWLPVEITVSTGPGTPTLEAGWFTAEDDRVRPFAQRRFLLPWARRAADAAPEPAAPPAELAGGDWHRGREVFFSERAQCGKCHSVRGKGGWIGPDLSNLIHRDYRSVLRDITTPSFAINPDHLAYNVVLGDGRVLSGMVQQRGDRLRIGDIKGVETEVDRADVEAMKPALISIMPEGLPQAIGAAGMRDLLTYLLAAEPGGLEAAPLERPGAPPPRTRAEVGAALKNAQPVDAASLKPLEILLVSGPKDHGPGEHDYPAFQARWSRLFGSAPAVRVARAEVWPQPEQWKTANVVMIFSANPAWAPERAKELDEYFARGGGLILLHYAVNGQRAPDEWARRIGLAWHPEQSRFRHGELDLAFPQPAHPITAGFTNLKLVDESYWNLVGDEKQVQVLATQVEEGKPRPILWTYEPGKGRVFASILGHYNWTFDDPLFRILLLRATAWVARQPIDRFNDLVPQGARLGASGAAPSGDRPSPGG